VTSLALIAASQGPHLQLAYDAAAWDAIIVAFGLQFAALIGARKLYATAAMRMDSPNQFDDPYAGC